VFAALPWHAALLPEGAVIGFAAALAGATIGALIGRALADDPLRRARVPVGVVVAAWVVALACLAIPLPMTAHPEQTAAVSLRTVHPFPDQRVTATVRVSPAGAAANADWFNVTAWQGARGRDGGLVISDLRPIGPGLFRTERPVPVGGQWKTLIRLETGSELQVVPIFMPLDQAIPAPLVPALPRFTRHFVPDKRELQREAVGGGGLQRVAYGLVALLALLWLASFGWGLRRLRLTRENVAAQRPWTQPDDTPYTVRSASG
jgi:hypothetical protein